MLDKFIMLTHRLLKVLSLQYKEFRDMSVYLYEDSELRTGLHLNNKSGLNSCVFIKKSYDDNGVQISENFVDYDDREMWLRDTDILKSISSQYMNIIYDLFQTYIEYSMSIHNFRSFIIYETDVPRLDELLSYSVQEFEIYMKLTYNI